MVNIKLQGNYECKICGKEYHWQDGLNDCRAVVIPESKHINGVTGATEFEIELERRCPYCNYLYKEVIKRAIPEYKEK